MPISLVTFLPLAVALGICLVPVCLLGHAESPRAQDYLVASRYTRPEVIGNASIGYALRMSAFGPLFAWGASGDLWPVIVASVFIGLGVYLVYVLRKPLLEFMDDALGDDRAITVHAFLARQHGNDPRVRALSASLTLCALLGLLVAEALALSAFLKPLLNGSVAVYLIMLGVLLLVASIAVFAGHSGVLHSSQLLLGMFYLGLLGSTLLLLYLHLSARTTMPVHGTRALACVAVLAVIALWYRRSKYVDTEPIRSAASSDLDSRASAGARALSRVEKMLNIFLSVLLALIIIVAVMELNAAGWATIVRDSTNALRARTELPATGLLALALLPLFYPLVDVTSWLRLAATGKDSDPRVDPGRRSMQLRGVLRICAVEVSLMWLFLCMFGAVAATATGMQASATVVQAFVAKLLAVGDIAVIVTPLLLICFFAAALSTMGALFSACLATVRYDMLAFRLPESSPGKTGLSREPRARRRTLVAGGVLVLAVAALFCVADAFLLVSAWTSTFAALVFALCCAQLSFFPLVVGAILRKRGGFSTVSGGWAVVILGSGVASSIVAVTVHFTTGSEAWLWSAAPLCLGSGVLLFMVARRASLAAA